MFKVNALREKCTFKSQQTISVLPDYESGNKASLFCSVSISPAVFLVAATKNCCNILTPPEDWADIQLNLSGNELTKHKLSKEV